MSKKTIILNSGGSSALTRSSANLLHFFWKMVPLYISIKTIILNSGGSSALTRSSANMLQSVHFSDKVRSWLLATKLYGKWTESDTTLLIIYNKVFQHFFDVDKNTLEEKFVFYAESFISIYSRNIHFSAKKNLIFCMCNTIRSDIWIWNLGITKIWWSHFRNFWKENFESHFWTYKWQRGMENKIQWWVIYIVQRK
jgi:hypothetical protein